MKNRHWGHPHGAQIGFELAEAASLNEALRLHDATTEV